MAEDAALGGRGSRAWDNDGAREEEVLVGLRVQGAGDGHGQVLPLSHRIHPNQALYKDCCNIIKRCQFNLGLEETPSITLEGTFGGDNDNVHNVLRSFLSTDPHIIQDDIFIN